MDSITRLAQYLGKYGQVSLRTDLFGQVSESQRKVLSTKNYVYAQKGVVVTNPLVYIKKILENYNSNFWQDFKDNLKDSVEAEARRQGKQITITEIIPEDPWLDSTVADEDEFWNELCRNNRIVIRGGITFGLEGISPPLVPDPDAVFQWELEFSANKSFSKVSVLLTIIFIEVDDPELGWLFAIIGFWIGGGTIFSLIGAGAGLAIGELLDAQYSNDQNQQKALRIINSGYDELKDFFDEFIESRSVFITRPTKRSIKIILDIVHLPSSAKGLHGIACAIRDIIDLL